MRHLPSATVLALALFAFAPPPAQAQPSPDFLFGRPGGMIGVRSGWLFARADSDLFNFVQEHLTIDRKDFNAPSIGVDVEVAITPRVSAVGGFDFSQTTTASEYRDFVDNQRLPITQTTMLREMNIGGSVKFALTPRGREISSRAWIPASATPYVGAGMGILRYDFKQDGDFIDVNTANLAVFSDTLRTLGWAPSAHVFGGLDVRLYRRLFVSGEARYLWSNATSTSRSFPGYKLDLTGLKATAGLHYMF